MRVLLAALLAALVLPGAATAAVTATPMSDPLVAVSQGSPLATLFTSTDAQTIDLNTNSHAKITVSNGTACPLTTIRRGTSRYRCTLPAGGSAFYSTTAASVTTYTTAYSTTGTVLANVSYLTTPKPFVPTVYTITCAYKGWGYYVPPPGCPPLGG